MKLFNVKFDWKLIGALFLIVGIVLGYSLNDALKAPKITRLTDELNQTDTALDALQIEFNTLQTEAEELRQNQTELNEQLDESVPKYLLDSLNENLQELNEEVDQLEEESYGLELDLLDLEGDYEYLDDQYTKLLAKYIEIRVLTWTAFELNGLNVNLTSIKNEYGSQEVVKGDITIKYSNGDPFEGTFKLKIQSTAQSAGRTSPSFTVDGDVNYQFENPFTYGNGQYKLTVFEIADEEGTVIADTYDMQGNIILLIVG